MKKLSDNTENIRLEESIVDNVPELWPRGYLDFFTEDFDECLVWCQRDLHINVNVFVFPCQKLVIKKLQFISYFLCKRSWWFCVCKCTMEVLSLDLNITVLIHMNVTSVLNNHFCFDNLQPEGEIALTGKDGIIVNWSTYLKIYETHFLSLPTLSFINNCHNKIFIIDTKMFFL